MYGYVIVNKPELKFKEYDRYRSYYCGLCDILREQYGIRGQVSLSYDMTFLVILLTGLYEPQTAYLEERCIVHPVAKHPVRKNEVTSYVADMNVLMAYYKCVDDWKDEKKVTRLTYSRLLKGQVKKICGKYPQKAEAIRQALSGLSAAEKAGEENIDRAASYFATVMSVVMAMKEDEWTEELQKMGYQLGKFIYLCDAYEDAEEDIKAGRYNVFWPRREAEGLDVHRPRLAVGIDIDAHGVDAIRAAQAGIERAVDLDGVPRADAGNVEGLDLHPGLDLHRPGQRRRNADQTAVLAVQFDVASQHEPVPDGRHLAILHAPRKAVLLAKPGQAVFRRARVAPPARPDIPGDPLKIPALHRHPRQIGRQLLRRDAHGRARAEGYGTDAAHERTVPRQGHQLGHDVRPVPLRT